MCWCPPFFYVPYHCWRCHAECCNMSHIWLGCPLSNISGAVSFKFTIELQTLKYWIPFLFLYFVIPGTIQSITKDVLCHFLTAAKANIPRYGQSPQVLSPAVWIVDLYGSFTRPNIQLILFVPISPWWGWKGITLPPLLDSSFYPPPFFSFLFLPLLCINLIPIILQT